MLDISNNNIITMTRGDTVTIPFNEYVGENTALANYVHYPNRYDKIYFAVMEPKQMFENAILKKAFNALQAIDTQTGVINIVLDSKDTEFLEPGIYYYQIKILKKDAFAETEPSDNEGRVATLVEKTKFIIID